MKKLPAPVRQRPQFEDLEPRILYSADAGALLPPDVLNPNAEVRVIDLSNPNQGSAAEQTATTTHEIVFVDTRVSNYPQLVDDLLANRDATRQIDVVLLDSARDGIAQIGEFLSQRHDIDAVHILSHGSDGSVALGSGQLNHESLLNNAFAIAHWGNALAGEADILIYGCDVAHQADGKAFVDELARLTGADVAASDDLTGSAVLGGDWNLEYRTNGIEANIAISAADQVQWQGVLANTAPVLDNTRSPTLTVQDEDAGAPVGAVGTLVSSLVDFAIPSGQVDNVTDPDAGALLGIAITAADSTNGSWFYSIDGGTNWSALGAVAGNNARLLAADANARLYFQPNADYNGTLASAITFCAWDQTNGANGDLRNTSPSGGTKAFSTVTDTASLTVTAVNDAPVITSNGGGATAALNVAENTTAVTTVSATDADLPGQTLTYSISGGADAAKFAIDTSTGALTFLAAQNYATPTDSGANNVYDVIVQVSDGILTDAQAIAVTVTVANTAPAITSNGGGATAALNVAENTTTVTAVTATDGDLPGQMLTYSIGGGADAAKFAIDASTGALTFLAAPNHATPTDSGANNVYDVIVQVSDGTLTDAQAIAVTVTVAPANTAPILDTGKSPALTVQNEDSSAPVGAVGTLVSSLVDFASPFGELDNVTDADAGSLLGIAITSTDSTDGTWYYSTDNGANWEAMGAVANNSARLLAADANTRIYFQPDADYNGTQVNAITFRAWDQSTGSNGSLASTTANGGSTAFSTVTDKASMVVNAVNDQPVRSNGTVSNLTVQEDASATSLGLAGVVYTRGGGNDENGQSLTYTVTAVPPAALGIITLADGITPVTAGSSYSHGQLTTMKFLPTANAYGGPAIFSWKVVDSGGTANGGLDTLNESLTITVTAVNDAPAITSNGGGANAALNVAENASAVTTVTATDADLPGQTLTYSISGGADAAKFAIDASTGALTFIAAPNFETPTDSSANNVYDVIVQVSDGTLTDSQAIAVTVSDASENTAPAITSNGGAASAALNVAENANAVTTVTATDADLPGQTLTYSISGGADSAKFAIDASTGALTFIAAPNFETPTDSGANNVYDVIVQVSDEILTDAQAIAITVTNVNEAPNASPIALTSIAEDGGARLITQAELLATATDVDGPALSATGLVIGSGSGSLADNGDGTWSYVPAADDDTSVSFTYTVSDGRLTTVGKAALDITPVTEAPSNPTLPAPSTSGSGSGSADPEPAKSSITQLSRPAETRSSDRLAVNPNLSSQTISANNEGAFIETVETLNRSVFQGANSLGTVVNLVVPLINNISRPFQSFDYMPVTFQLLEPIELSVTGVPSTLNSHVALFNGYTTGKGIHIENIEFVEPDTSLNQAISQLFIENKVVISSAAISAGLVSWATQYSAIFSSILATVPAWRNLDPVALLGKSDEDKPEWEGAEEECEENAEETAADIMSEKIRAHSSQDIV